MSLRADITRRKTEALKSKDELRLSVLRMLWSEIKNTEIDKKEELDDKEIEQIVARQIKQLKDAIKDFSSAGRDDLVSKNELEISKMVKKFSKYSNKVDIKNGESLSDLLAIIGSSRGVISNETCTAHMGVALGKRVYCISGKLGYNRMHPYPNYKRAIYIYPPNFEK